MGETVDSGVPCGVPSQEVWTCAENSMSKKNYKVSSVTVYLVTIYDPRCQRTVVYLECRDYVCTENV